MNSLSTVAPTGSSRIAIYQTNDAICNEGVENSLKRVVDGKKYSIVRFGNGSPCNPFHDGQPIALTVIGGGNYNMFQSDLIDNYKEDIGKFAREGGSYLGICAGAIAASQFARGFPFYNKDGAYTTYTFQSPSATLQLYPGLIAAPLAPMFAEEWSYKDVFAMPVSSYASSSCVKPAFLFHSLGTWFPSTLPPGTTIRGKYNFLHMQARFRKEGCSLSPMARIRQVELHEQRPALKSLNVENKAEAIESIYYRDPCNQKSGPIALWGAHRELDAAYLRGTAVTNEQAQFPSQYWSETRAAIESTDTIREEMLCEELANLGISTISQSHKPT
jgi:hypothetical protein